MGRTQYWSEHPVKWVEVDEGGALKTVGYARQAEHPVKVVGRAQYGGKHPVKWVEMNEGEAEHPVRGMVQARDTSMLRVRSTVVEAAMRV